MGGRRADDLEGVKFRVAAEVEAQANHSVSSHGIRALAKKAAHAAARSAPARFDGAILAADGHSVRGRTPRQARTTLGAHLDND